MARKTLSQLNEIIECVHDRDILTPSREIFITGHLHDNDFEINNKTAIDFIKNLKILESQSGDPITVHIHSPGGQVSSGLAIYDAAKASCCEITIIGHGEICSAATIIIQAADQRVLMPNCRFHIHNLHSSYSDDVLNLSKYQKESERLSDIMIKIYSEKSNLTQRKIKGWLEKEREIFLSAQEALKYRLIDRIENDIE